MDFFAYQDRARRQTSLLLVYLCLAVVLIVLAVYVAFWLILGASSLKTQTPGALSVWEPRLFAWVVGGTVAIIVCGTLYKLIELRAGGVAVAEMLGGTLVPHNTQDFRQRQLLNVVEEMSIASGVAVPAVYVLEEEGSINAFAAGYTPADAVVGVTRGCLEHFNRDELQGVIAHEFSHILNGDMRLNLRLIGILHGILVIALIGYGVFRGALYTSGRSSSRRGKDGGGKLAIVLLGLALIAIGYIGVLFARLIQSAVSRQREYLADASAVQFTRNPAGFASALKKIAALSRGSRIDEPKAAEASHLFFGSALGAHWFTWMATHPPLTERIRRVDPSFDGSLPAMPATVAPPDVERTSPADARPMISYEQASRQAHEAAGPAHRIAWQPTALVAGVGAPSGDHLEYAVRLRESLPAALTEAIQDRSGAQAVVYALLLDASPSVRRSQDATVANAAPVEVREAVDRLQPLIAGLPAGYRIAVLDLALPALKELPPAQLTAFQETAQKLAAADQEISLFEYALQAVLQQRFRAWLEPEKNTRVEYYSLNPLSPDCRLLLSTLAYVGAGDIPAESSFTAAAAPLGSIGALGITPSEQCSLAAVDQALQRLSRLSHPLRRRVLTACLQVVLADRKVDVGEAELLRAIAAALDCPMPPLLADESAA